MPSDPAEISRDISFQRRMFDLSCGDRMTEIEAVFGFSLDELPTIDRGEVDKHPVDFAQPLSFRLKDGREISLTELHQYQTYAGYLEGLPHPYVAFRQALDVAKEKFPWYDAKPISLPPVRYAGIYVNENFRSAWTTVPLVCSIACFTSLLPARDVTQTQSDALVIWFQDRFGLELDQRTLDQIRELDWKANAMDWSY